MPRNAHRAFALAAGCSVIVGLGIASCSDESLRGEVTRFAAPVEPITEIAAAVTAPPGLRPIDVPACARGADNCPNHHPQPFYVAEIRQSETHLYVAFKYRGAQWSDGSAPAAELVATVSIDGCAVGRLTTRGAVRQSRAGVSWVEVRVADLPDGELDLRLTGTVGTASVGSSIMLEKTGTSIGYLPLERRRGFHRFVQTDPGTGKPLSLVTVDEATVECPL